MAVHLRTRLDPHPDICPRPQSHLHDRLRHGARFRPEANGLQHDSQNGERLHLSKVTADADPRACAKRHVGVTMTLPRLLRCEALGIKPLRIVLECCMVVHGVNGNDDDGTFRNHKPAEREGTRRHSGDDGS